MLRGDGCGGSSATKVGIDVATEAGRGFLTLFPSRSRTPPPVAGVEDPEEVLSVTTLLGRVGGVAADARKDLRPSGIVLRAEQ